MVLAGGVALGAYQAGAFAAMDDALRRRVSWLAGASIGAVNAALIAGNSAGRRLEALGAFWTRSWQGNGVVARHPDALRHWSSWIGAAQSRILGRAGVFAPAMRPGILAGRAPALYSLAPLAETLRSLVDFGRLNSGALRVSVMATDLRTGEPVVFDTGRGDVIGVDHILASCGFIPEFEPTEIDGRLLGDGALFANTPVELVVGQAGPQEDLLCFVLDLFARDLGRPLSLEAAMERRQDLLLGNPTHRALDALEREDALRRQLAEALDQVPRGRRDGPRLAEARAAARRGRTRVLHLSYRAPRGEAGPEKQFDFSQASLRGRWEAGAADMRATLELLQREAGEGPRRGFTVERLRR